MGRRGTTSVHVLTGTAWVGDHQASIGVGGWTYGFAQSMPMWIDGSGTEHDGGWPACLDRIGSHPRIRFGAVPVTDPNGLGQREVVWVDCRG
ncbi:MAG TPA: hypothetical protein VGH79_08705 [Gaiellaceae bacterium]